MGFPSFAFLAIYWIGFLVVSAFKWNNLFICFRFLKQIQDKHVPEMLSYSGGLYSLQTFVWLVVPTKELRGKKRIMFCFFN